MGGDHAIVEALAHAAQTVATGAAAVSEGHEGSDPLHDLRVGLRRTRSLVRVFGAGLEPTWTTTVEREVKELSVPMGIARDLDVFIEGLDAWRNRLDPMDHAALDRLIEGFAAERDGAYVTLRRSLATERWAALEALLARPQTGIALTEDEVATELALRWRKLTKLARRCRKDCDEAELHRLRVRVKRLRYSLDAGALVLGRLAAAHAKALAKVQDELGTLRDASEAQRRLRAAADGDAGVSLVAGQLIAFNRSAYDRARARWPKRWRQANGSDLLDWRD